MVVCVDKSLPFLCVYDANREFYAHGKHISFIVFNDAAKQFFRVE